MLEMFRPASEVKVKEIITKFPNKVIGWISDAFVFQTSHYNPAA